jgi:hypothetical protein
MIEIPKLVAEENGHSWACHLYTEAKSEEEVTA